MFPNVFPLNLGSMKTYKKSQTSPKSVKKLQNEVHCCDALVLAAILDAILDVEKMPNGKLNSPGRFCLYDVLGC